MFIYYMSQLIGSALVTTVPGLRSLGTESSVVQFWYVLVVEAITLGLLYWFLRGRKLTFASLGLIKPRLRDVGITLLAYPPYFILNAIAFVLATSLLHLDSGQAQQTGFETAASSNQLILTFISLVILPPLVEEIMMRGFLFGSLKNAFSAKIAAIITSVLFAAAHLQFGTGAPLLWLAAIDTFVLSLVLCYVRQKTGSLWAGIGLHALKNGLAFYILFIVPQHILPWTS